MAGRLWSLIRALRKCEAVRSAGGSVLKTRAPAGELRTVVQSKDIKDGRQSHYRTQTDHVSDNRAIAFSIRVFLTRVRVSKYIRPWRDPRRHN
jgi:hypothetical protein